MPLDVSLPIAYVGATSGANNNSPLTLNVPAGVQAGDLLIAQVGYERTMAVSVPTPGGGRVTSTGTTGRSTGR